MQYGCNGRAKWFSFEDLTPDGDALCCLELLC